MVDAKPGSDDDYQIMGDLASGKYYGVFIDDSGSPGLRDAPSMLPKGGKTWDFSPAQRFETNKVCGGWDSHINLLVNNAGIGICTHRQMRRFRQRYLVVWRSV